MPETAVNTVDFEVTVDSTTLKLHEKGGEGEKVKLIRVTLDSEGPAQFELVLHTYTTKQPVEYPGSAYQIGAEVKVKLGYKESGTEELFDGLATRVDATFHELDSPHYRLAGYDRLHMLTRGRYTEHWQSVKYSDIVSAVAGNFSLSADCDATSESYDHVSMNNETYYSFLQGLASRSGRLLGCEGKKILFKEPKPSGGEVATLVFGENLRRARFTSSSAGQVSKVWVLGYDPEANKQIIGKAGSSDITATKGGSQLGAELVDSKFGQGGDRKNELWITDVAAKTQSDVDNIAKAALNLIAEKFSRVEAECEGDPAILPHTKIKFEGVTNIFEGEWYVISAVHEYAAGTGSSKGYRTKLVARRAAWSPPS